MKKQILSFGLILFTVSSGHGQINEPSGELLFTDTISLGPLSGWISIPSPADNVWESGIPGKDYFDCTLSGKAAMVTDTADTYPALADDYFLLSIPATEFLYLARGDSFFLS
jgi:hypothetical protein